MAFTNDWDETTPTDSTQANQIDDFNRKSRLDVRERLAVDHVFTSSDTGQSVGEATLGNHKQVTLVEAADIGTGATGKPILGAQTVVAPELVYTDEGDVDVQITNAGKIGGADVELVAGKDLIGSATSDITLNTDKFTVAGATGNTLVGGTFDIQGTTAVVGVLDEDDLTSDSATNLATQQSIKAYVDGRVCRCTNTAGQVLTANAWTVMNLDTDSFDPNNISDLPNNKIVPNLEGYYLCTAFIDADSLDTAVNSYQIQLWKNGDTSVAIKVGTNINNLGSINLDVNDIIFFDGSTDSIQVRFNNGDATNAGITAGGGIRSYLSIARIGG